MSKLTPLQERFCEEYIIDLNGAAAYKRAGYKARGNSAEANASRMLRIAKVQNRIDELKSERSIRTQITADRVLEEWARLGFSSLTNYMTWGPEGATMMSSDELSVDEAPAVESVKESKTYAYSKDGDLLSETVNTQFKLHSKVQALGALSKHLNLYDDVAGNPGTTVNVNNTVNVENNVTQERKDSFEELFREIDEFREGTRAGAVEAGDAPE